MYEADHLLRLIEPRLAELGMSQADFGEAAFGIRRNSAIQDMKKGSTPSIDRLAAMAAVLGFECYFGPPRDGPAPTLRNDISGTPACAGRLAGAPDGYATIPWHRNIGLAAEAPVSFSRIWLNRHRISLDRTAALPIGPRARNMETFAAFALVDVDAPMIGGPDLWAVASRDAPLISAEIGVEQVQFDAQATVLLPGPTRQKAEILPQSHAVHARLLGRVIWLGKLVAPDPLPA